MWSKWENDLQKPEQRGQIRSATASGWNEGVVVGHRGRCSRQMLFPLSLQKRGRGSKRRYDLCGCSMMVSLIISHAVAIMLPMMLCWGA